MFFTPLFTGLSSLQVFQSKDTPEKFATPEELIRMTKGITVATAKSVAAGNSGQQEDVIATANLSRKAIADMLLTCKVLIALAQQSPSHSSSHTYPQVHRCTFDYTQTAHKISSSTPGEDLPGFKGRRHMRGLRAV